MSSGGNRTWRRTLALWAAVVVLCAAVTGVSRAVEASYRQARSEQVRQSLKSSLLYSQLFCGVRYECQSPEGIEALFNKGQPLLRLPSLHPFVTRVALPGAALGPDYQGWKVRLTFGAGTLGRQTLRSYSATPPPGDAGPSAATLDLLARLRRAMLVFGGTGSLIAPGRDSRASSGGAG